MCISKSTADLQADGIALGSTEVKTTDLLKECTREEAAQLAADDLKATTAEVKLEGATKNFFVYGLDRKNKHPLRILDKKGFIKVQRNDGKAVLCKAGQLPQHRLPAVGGAGPSTSRMPFCGLTITSAPVPA